MRITAENFIKHLKKNREEALQYVIDEYIGIVKAIIYNALKSYNDPQIIEECISDTFLGAYENAKQFKGDKEDFRKWICTIAKYKAITKQRKLSKAPFFYEIDETGNAVHCGLTKAAINNRLYRGKKRLQQIHLGGSMS